MLRSSHGVVAAAIRAVHRAVAVNEQPLRAFAAVPPGCGRGEVSLNELTLRLGPLRIWPPAVPAQLRIAVVEHLEVRFGCVRHKVGVAEIEAIPQVVRRFVVRH